MQICQLILTEVFPCIGSTVVPHRGFLFALVIVVDVLSGDLPTLVHGNFVDCFQIWLTQIFP